MLNKLIEEVKDLICDWLNKIRSRIKFLLLFIAFLILMGVIFALPKIEPLPENIQQQDIRIFSVSINNLFLWFSFVTILIGACWAIYQYNKGNKIKQQEKSVNIAKQFANDLIDDMSIINLVIQRTHLSKYIPDDDIDDEIEFFDVDEVRRLYKSDEIIDKYKSEWNVYHNTVNDIYRLIVYLINHSMEKDEQNRYMKDIFSKKLDWGKIEDFFNSYYINANLPFYFEDLEKRMLNKLEYICMDISSKAADSSFIYQSLHQMFLRSIRNLYFEISYKNTNNSDKLYVNIIYVYNQWKKIYKNRLRKEKSTNKKINKLVNPPINQIYY